MPHILIATDIFGYTSAIDQLKERLAPLCGAVHIIDPYGAKHMKFHDESEAYEAFTQLCGLENYAKACIKTLDALSNENVILIGFSMGASALWKALDGRKDVKIKSFFGFYSSQIRHFLDAKVHIPCTFVFPKYEKHFDVDAVIAQLLKHENITCLKTAYLHGFMNPLSLNYDAKGYREYCLLLEENIKAFYLLTALSQL